MKELKSIVREERSVIGRGRFYCTLKGYHTGGCLFTVAASSGLSIEVQVSTTLIDVFDILAEKEHGFLVEVL